MNYQFFGTAGICSAVLWIIAVVLMLLYFSDIFCYDTEDKLVVFTWICFLLPIAFWLVMGVICGLNAIWGWGLVK